MLAVTSSLAVTVGAMAEPEPECASPPVRAYTTNRPLAASRSTMSMQTERYPAMLSPSVVPSIVPKLNIIKGLESLDLEDVGEPPASAVASPPTSPRHQGLAGGSAGESARLFWSRDDQKSGAQVGKVAFNVAKDPTTSTITSTANSSMVDPCFRHPSSPLSRNITAAIPEHEAHRPRDTLTGNRRRRHRGATDTLPCVSGHRSTVIDRAERLRTVTDRRSRSVTSPYPTTEGSGSLGKQPLRKHSSLDF